MKPSANLLSCISTFSLIAGVAFAGPADAPVSSDGSQGAAPRSGSAVVSTVTPSRGAEVPDAARLRSEGAIVAPSNAPFPANGLASVARGAGAGPESVIGYDSRRRVYTNLYPSRAIVFIELNGQHLCTGFMYSPNMVATAGHCVHTGGSTGTWRSRIQMRVYAGRDGAASPFGFCTVARLHSVTGWTQSANPRFDYGAMRLNCTVGSTVGWFGLYAPTDSVLLNSPAIVSGYPGDKPRDQWTSSDKIRQVIPEMIAYRMDTIGGHSGSPVWHDRDEATFASGAWAIGVHNYGTGLGLFANANSAARLSSARITNYVNWRNLP